MRKNDKGFTVQFWLACFNKRPQSQASEKPKEQSNQAPAEITYTNVAHNCPVCVKFRWSNDRMSYVRQKSGLITHHNHPAEIKDKHYLNDELIRKELELFAKCGLSVSNIYNIIKKKFTIKIRYQDVYSRISVLKKELGLK